MGGIYVSVEEAPTLREMIRPWWLGLVVTAPQKPKLFIDCKRYPELCGEFEVPADIIPPWEGLVSGIAAAALLGSAGYPNPDGTGPDPDGPWGPVIRDSIAALGILQLANAIEDREFAGGLQALAGGLAQRQAERIQEMTART